MTNYENMIRDMTPEKLAELISENTLDNPCHFCAYRDETRCGFRCIDGTEEWLKQKVRIRNDESRSNSNAQTDTRARGMGATDKSSGI